VKAVKLLILAVAEVVCLVAFVAMCQNTVTKESLLPAARYWRDPTEENRLAAEQAKRAEQRFLWTVRGGLGLALLWNSWAIVRVVRAKKQERSANDADGRGISETIRRAFPGGLDYDDAAQLCLALYSFRVLPDELMCQCTKENLAAVFSELASAGFIRVTTAKTAVRYGASSHDPGDTGHWIEVIASILKIGDTVDVDRGRSLTDRLTTGS